jgi:hypothetical protein
VPEALRAPKRAVQRRLSAADLLDLAALDAPAEPPPPVPEWPKAMKQILETDIEASLEALVEARTAALLRAADETRRAEESARQHEKLAALVNIKNVPVASAAANQSDDLPDCVNAAV